MNLKEMRDMVANIIDYNPDVTAYNEEINKIINEVYLNFFMTQPWSFAQKTIDTYTLPDVTQTDLTITPNAGNAYLKNFLEGMNNTTGIGQHFNSGQMSHEGSYFKLTDSTTPANSGIYVIDKIDNGNTQMHVSKVSYNKQFANWAGPAGATTVTGLAFQRYLMLPKDCAQILSVGIRNLDETGTGLGNGLGHIYNLTRANEEQYNYRFDITGTPTMWFAYDREPNGYQDVTHFVPRANKDFFVELHTTAPGWPQGTYEFAMAYVWHGVEGPMSDALEVVINEGNKIPRFNTLDTRQFGVAGLRKRFYVRLKSLSGFNSTTHQEDFFRELAGPRYSVIPQQDNTSFFLIDDYDVQRDWPQANITLDTVDRLRMLARHKAPITTRWRIRLHPRPTEETPITIRYVSYPVTLVDDKDTPESPIDTHRYIVYRACQEVLFKHGEDTQAVYYERKADKELQKIEERWLTQRSALYIKGGFKSGPLRLRPYRVLSKQTGKDGA
jgi:hypothetical protein|tara:strand:- start:18126 stop:19619 length:1494 start_codon:yes stop_codon:yes gene_type:complete